VTNECDNAQAIEGDEVPKAPASERDPLHELQLLVGLVVPVEYAKAVRAVNSIGKQHQRLNSF